VKSFSLGKYALSGGVAVALLAACGGSQPPIGTPGAMSQFSNAHTHRSTTSSGNALLYIAKTGNDYGTLILSYPAGKQVNRINRVLGPMCTDPNTGNVYIISGGTIREYAPDKKHSIGLLTTEEGEFDGCAVDPTTGDLAVTVYAGPNERYSVWIYQNLSSTPAKYFARMGELLDFCGFDSQGNLFVDGYNKRGFLLAELPVGASKITKISLDLNMERDGPVQWDGTYITVENPMSDPEIYRIAVSGSKGTVVGVTKLGSRVGQYPVHSWIQGNTVIAPDGPTTQNNIVGYWHYPKGGRQPYSVIKNVGYAQYVLVSKRQN